MAVARETLCLRRIMQMVAEGKTLTLEPDWDGPYTLKISDPEKGTVHTHNSYSFDDLDEQAVLLSVESLCDQILEGRGLDFAQSKGGKK